MHSAIMQSKARKAKKRQEVEAKAKTAATKRGPAKGQTKQVYNQAYWADRVAKVGSAQATAEMKQVGTKKGYSGDRVVSRSNTQTAQKKLKDVTGSMAVLDNLTENQKKQLSATTTKKGGIDTFLDVGGVTKSSSKSGLLGEHTKTDYQYGDGTKITTAATDPVLPQKIGMFDLGGLAGTRLGDKVTKTYVDGIQANTMTGGDELGNGAVTKQTDDPVALGDTAKIEPMNLKTIADIDRAITNTTDKAALAELHKRRQKLMRTTATRTQHSPFALGMADVARNFLMGIK